MERVLRAVRRVVLCIVMVASVIAAALVMGAASGRGLASANPSVLAAILLLAVLPGLTVGLLALDRTVRVSVRERRAAAQ